MTGHSCTIAWRRSLRRPRARGTTACGSSRPRPPALPRDRVDSDSDAAQAVLGTIAPGRQGITDIVLRPQAVFSGARQPEPSGVEALHHAAHERCCIASSLRSTVRVQGDFRAA